MEKTGREAEQGKIKPCPAFSIQIDVSYFTGSLPINKDIS